jgi:ABC-type nickel/cobalt efflux system permease component RcnA
MENMALILIFWYGILHAFGADHLTAIADFSIGKNKKKTLLITAMFAIGHGISLFIFAKILESYHISDEILAYGDVISASVILGMGIYLLWLVFTNRINLNKHVHDGVEHIHIYFGKEHSHSNKDISSAFAIGTLMGIGGVRGMLVTLGLVESASVDFTMVLAFTLGVMIIFLAFGAFILYINKNLLTSKQNIRRVFTIAGVISLIVGTNFLLG